MLPIDLKGLRSMLTYVSDHAKEYTTTYGNMSSQSVGAIHRALIAVEDQEGDTFFGEPAPELSDWFVCDANGHEYVSILNAPCAAWPTRLHPRRAEGRSRVRHANRPRAVWHPPLARPLRTQPSLKTAWTPCQHRNWQGVLHPIYRRLKTPRPSANLNPAASRPPRYFSLFAMA